MMDGVRVRPLEAPAEDLAQPWHDQSVTLGHALAKERPDVVHVMHPMRFPHVFAEAAAAQIPLVAHVPDFYYPCARITMVQTGGALCTSPEEGERCVSACAVEPGLSRFAWGRNALASAAAVISPSRATIGLHSESGFDTSRWHHVPWGVDYALHPRRLKPPPNGPLRVGFLGTLLEHKGAQVAVDAISSHPELGVELRLYGESFHEEEYERSLRRAADGDPRVVFAGAYEHAELAAILAGLDAVAIPSLWHENLPTTGLNAIAAGVPLLVSDVGGLLELLDDYDCGFAFRRGDPEDLAGLLERLVRKRGTLPGIRARMLYPPSLEEEARRLEAIYETVSARRATSVALAPSA